MQHVKDHRLDHHRVYSWLSSFDDPEVRKCASYIIGNAVHISWCAFQNELMGMNRRVIDGIRGEFHLYRSPARKSSITFFSSYVYDNMGLINNEKCKGVTTDLFLTNHIVYVDDMSFSGSQITQVLRTILRKQIESVVRDERSSTPVFKIRIALHADIYRRHKLKKPNTGIIFLSYFRQDVRDIYVFECDENGKTNFHHYHEILSLIRFLNRNKHLRILDSLPMEFFKMIPNSERKFLDGVEKIHRMHFHVGIPFMSAGAIKLLREWNQKYGLSVRVKDVEYCTVFPTLLDIYKICTFKKELEVFLYFHFGYLISVTSVQQKTYESLQKMEKLHPNQQAIFGICPVWFDHKLSSPVSTISVILGCGLSVSYNHQTNKMIRPVKMMGSLLRNCPIRITEEMRSFMNRFYGEKKEEDNEYDPEMDEKVCTGCPIPFYKLDD